MHRCKNYCSYEIVLEVCDIVPIKWERNGGLSLQRSTCIYVARRESITRKISQHSTMATPIGFSFKHFSQLRALTQMSTASQLRQEEECARTPRFACRGGFYLWHVRFGVSLSKNIFHFSLPTKILLAQDDRRTSFFFTFIRDSIGCLREIQTLSFAPQK